MTTQKLSRKKLIGLLFITPMFFYGFGNTLLEAGLKGADRSLLTGAFFIICNSINVIMLGLLLFPFLKQVEKRLAWIYLSARFLEGLLLVLGLCSLLYMHWGAGAETMFRQAHFICYQSAMLSLGLGSLGFCYLIYRTKMVPAPLAIWGGLGYALLALGTILELFGLSWGLALSMPGGLFELFLGFYWLLKR